MLFVRYPIFLLALGPPIFRPADANAGVNAAQAHFDLWNLFQVVWISLIALRAIIRLTRARTIFIPRQVRFVLILAFFLNLLFFVSVSYSPGPIISTEFSVLYFFTLVCVVEFVVDVYRDPPNWMKLVFQLRLISFLLLAAVLVAIPLASTFVFVILPGAGIRLTGGAVAPVTVICPFISIISAYSFLHSLEPRIRSFLFFLVGLAGTAISQTRGAEIALFLMLVAIVLGWARLKRQSAHLFIAGLMASILIGTVIVGAIGGESIWKIFNRGGDTENVMTGSGRAEVWKFAVSYTLTHPQGMGYVAGFRTLFPNHFDLYVNGDQSHLGNTHNTFLQYLADAGWLALGLYLIMMAKTLALGWRFSKKPALVGLASDSVTRHATRCALLLLVYCLLEGMEASDFAIPLRQPFSIQYAVVAMILGISAGRLAASRARYFPLAN
jgi:O-antigen ligase